MLYLVVFSLSDWEVFDSVFELCVIFE